MDRYNMKCPVCGRINHQLFLEETDGWMECEYCGETTQQLRRTWKRKSPRYPARDIDHVAIPAV